MIFIRTCFVQKHMNVTFMKGHQRVNNIVWFNQTKYMDNLISEGMKMK